MQKLCPIDPRSWQTSEKLCKKPFVKATQLLYFGDISSGFSEACWALFQCFEVDVCSSPRAVLLSFYVPFCFVRRYFKIFSFEVVERLKSSQNKGGRNATKFISNERGPQFIMCFISFVDFLLFFCGKVTTEKRLSLFWDLSENV